MDSLQIKYFLKVAEHLNFTKAAQELFISQPSVSKQIASLEKELGFRLFNRNIKNQIVLTPAGMKFQEVFSEMAEEFRDAMDAADALMGQPRGRLKVGIVEGWDLAPFICECSSFFEEYYPGVELEFQSHPFKQLYVGLELNTLDVILCLEPGLRKVEDLYIRKLIDIPTVVLFSAKHALANRRGLCLTDFKHDNCYILPADETPLSADIFRGNFLARGFEPKMIEKPNRDSILVALSGGSGYAIFDAWTRYQKYPDFRTLRFGSALTVCIVWRKQSDPCFIELFDQKFREWVTKQNLEPGFDNQN